MPPESFATDLDLERDDRLARSTERLVRSAIADPRIHHPRLGHLPDRDAIAHLLVLIRRLLFPGFAAAGRTDALDLAAAVRTDLDAVCSILESEVEGAIAFARSLRAEADGGAGDAATTPSEDRAVSSAAAARAIALMVIDRLPSVRAMLSLDVQAAMDGDPAARFTDEIVLCYPGLRAIMVHRVAHELERLRVPIVPRLMSELVHAETGIDIHPGARIGRSFFIDHGTGVVIGETTVIGDGCKIYQGVTLGARSFPRDERGRLARDVKRHPTLEDHVTVYAGATILGGETVIGAGCVIGGGVFVTSSVPAGHVVRGPVHEVSLRTNPESPATNWVI